MPTLVVGMCLGAKPSNMPTTSVGMPPNYRRIPGFRALLADWRGPSARKALATGGEIADHGGGRLTEGAADVPRQGIRHSGIAGRCGLVGCRVAGLVVDDQSHTGGFRGRRAGQRVHARRTLRGAGGFDLNGDRRVCVALAAERRQPAGASGGQDPGARHPCEHGPGSHHDRHGRDHHQHQYRGDEPAGGRRGVRGWSFKPPCDGRHAARCDLPPCGAPHRSSATHEYTINRGGQTQR